MMTYTPVAQPYEVTVMVRVLGGIDDPDDLLFSNAVRDRDFPVVYDLRNAYSLFSEQWPDPLIVLGRKPRVRHDRFIQGMDAFGNYISTIGHFMTDWEFGSTGVTPAREHPVTHVNVLGKTQPTDFLDTLYPPLSGGYCGLKVDCCDLGVPTLVPCQFDETLQDTGLFSIPDLSTYSYISDGGVAYAFRNLRIEGARLKYTRVKTWYEDGWYNKRVEEIWVKFQVTPHSTALVPGIEYSCEGVLNITGYVGKVFIGSISARDPEMCRTWDTDFEYDITNDEYVTYSCIGVKCFLARYVSYRDDIREMVLGTDHPQNLIAFESFTMSLLRDCYAANFFSSANAIDNYMTRTSSNHIEFLAELGSITAVLDLLPAIRAVYAARHSPGDAVGALLKLLSSAKLLYSFGIAPTIGDAEDVANKVKPLVRKFASSWLYTPQTVHGKWSYQIPEDRCGPFYPLTLTARTELRIALKRDSLLATLLPARAANLLPTVSTLWDLVPFSFLVDWIIPIGRNTDALESQMCAFMADVSYSVNTLRLDFPLADVLPLFHARNSDGAESVYRCFDRYVLSHAPTVAPTSLPIFTSGPGVPDWALFGSLVCQWLRF